MSLRGKREKLGRVITYGTFDLFHYGHLRIIERAAALGDCLIVGVSSDEFNLIKGKTCHYSFKHRSEIVQSIRWVEKVIPEHTWDQKVFDILNYKIDTLVMGSDWEGHFDYLNEYCQVLYFARTKGISTSIIKQTLNGMK